MKDLKDPTRQKFECIITILIGLENFFK